MYVATVSFDASPVATYTSLLHPKNKKVEVVINSRAATDVAAVHGGYSRYRKRLLEGNVSIYEMKPHADTSKRAGIAGFAGGKGFQGRLGRRQPAHQGGGDRRRICVRRPL